MASGSLGTGFAVSFLLKVQVTSALGFFDPQHYHPSSKHFLVLGILPLQSHFCMNSISLFLVENANVNDLMKMRTFFFFQEKGENLRSQKQ